VTGFGWRASKTVVVRGGRPLWAAFGRGLACGRQRWLGRLPASLPTFRRWTTPPSLRAAPRRRWSRGWSGGSAA